MNKFTILQDTFDHVLTLYMRRRDASGYTSSAAAWQSLYPWLHVNVPLAYPLYR